MDAGSSGLDGLQSALSHGDIASMRKRLLALSDADLRLLEEEIGADATACAIEAASRSRRSGRLGKVIVLPGIMGSLLDSIDRRGDADRVWVNAARLINGRFEDLEMTVPGGSPAAAGVRIATPGVHRKTYIPLLAELDTRWEVRPFAFDWREDIRKSAERLDGEIRAFGGAGPVHLVADSMGGLVSRYVARHFADTWTSMSDGATNQSGGRLVMLGTPNRGSFAPALALTGADKLVRRLALADRKHSLDGIRSKLATFSGLYQMLPSPHADLDGDDHNRLFDASAWPGHVHQELLDRGRELQTDLDEIVDPHRLVYVAGYDQDTPWRIHVDGRRSFRYDMTREGDGRVPHELGLLDGVQTYFVDDKHGDLPKNGHVLDSIHDLLETGLTTALPGDMPRRSATTRGTTVPSAAVDADRAGDIEVAKLAEMDRATPMRELSPREQIRLETLITEDYLGRGGVDRATTATDAAPPLEKPIVEITVVWGDVTKVSADLYSVGHYRGVMPQRAEWALDQAISGSDRVEGIIAAQTRRGALSADVGDISFFPWSGEQRVVAVTGMGQPGSFDAAALRRLVRSTTIAALDLPDVQTWCTVLIGSGEGTVEPELAVQAWFHGLADALAETRLQPGRSIPRILVAELYKGRAERIARAFHKAAAQKDIAGTIEVRTSRTPRPSTGRKLSEEDARTLVIKEIAQRDQAARKKLLDRLKLPKSLRADVETFLKGVAEPKQDREPSSEVPTRISFSTVDDAICVAAINETATVPQRIIPIDPGLLTDLAERMTDPPEAQAPMLGCTLFRFLIPQDFRALVAGAGPFVFEVDRPTARFHWEMCDDSAVAGSGEPLGVRSEVARQLRTTYSSAAVRSPSARRLRALVIGDPGDPERRHDLPGARSEALRVRDLLVERGVDVDARIGAPSVARTGPLSDVGPADRLELLYLLSTGNYDLVHYAGHGDFDEQRPDRVGWLFASGLLTPNEIQALDQPPGLVVANACLSARTSGVGADEHPVDEVTRRSTLVPSLADEFLKLGVRDYVGTAWEVNDIGAEQFAATMYRKLFPAAGEHGATIGNALQVARRELWTERERFGSLWGAYQHYGDPNTRLANMER